MISLVCRGRPEFKHRRVTVYAYDGPLPPPFEHTGYSLDLLCRRCGYAPRVSNAELAALLMIASKHGGSLDLGQRIELRYGTLSVSPPVEG